MMYYFADDGKNWTFYLVPGPGCEAHTRETLSHKESLSDVGKRFHLYLMCLFHGAKNISRQGHYQSKTVK